MEPRPLSGPALAAAITRAASQQAYYTVRFLVDRALVNDAYRAYAYFRWVDDWLDRDRRPRSQCLAFVQRQQDLLGGGYRGEWPSDLSPEERLLADLIQGDAEQNSGLRAYLHNMMAVMAFDANRRERVVSQRELNQYTHWLAVAVTEALHYFIGHNCASPRDETRYLAASGAHIVHMLRDALEDAQAGYYNIPREVLVDHRLACQDVESSAYRDWVQDNARRARAYFRAGRDYLARVENLRCRIAGLAYIRRFEVVLDSIEREGYLLRAAYPERKEHGRGLEIIGRALWTALLCRPPAPAPSVLQVR
jgi:hypothetical protein